MPVAHGVWLRAVEPPDLPIHYAQQRDPASSAMAAVPVRDRAAFDAHWAAMLADPEVHLRSVVRGDEVVGSVLAFPRDGQRQVGYRIGCEHWGQGLASAALALLLEEVPERPLHARVAEHNVASLRVLERCGFRSIARERADDVLLWVLRLG
ncbi:MAG TPA: GNAT family N-acetyltransferase [Baekduia sp.]|nr:GNAT family N-acetyltransferase [Baekduia sp.]